MDRRLAPTLAVLLLAACHAPPRQATAPAPASPAPAAPDVTAPGATARPSAVSALVAEFRSQSDRVTAQVAQDRQALETLRNQRAALSGQYSDHVSTIQARLQAATTPGNPELIAIWQQAQSALTGLDDTATRLSDLKAKLSSDSAEAGHLASSAAAALALEGAGEPDRAALAEIQSQASSNQVDLDRLVSDAAHDVDGQTVEMAAANRDLPTLLRAIAAGAPPGAEPNAVAGAGPTAPTAQPSPTAEFVPPPSPTPPPNSAERDPTLVVAAAQSPAEYEPALYNMVSEVLGRSRKASVEVVAVLPGEGPPTARALATAAARRKAEAVARALISFGVAPDHLSTSVTQGNALSTGEVWIYAHE